MIAKSERFEMRLDQQMLDRLDAWRDAQDGEFSRAEAVRRLLDRALESAGRTSVAISGAERLIIGLLAEVHRATVPAEARELEPDFIMSAINGGHNWALEWKYSGLLHHLVDDRRTMSEVVQILDMWTYVESSFNRLSESAKTRIEEETGTTRERFKFAGFSGNDETEHLSVATFLIEQLGRFSNFKEREIDFHFPIIDRYRRMLRVFEPLRARYMGEPLASPDLVAVLGAR